MKPLNPQKPTFSLKKALLVAGSIAIVAIVILWLLTVKQDEGQQHVSRQSEELLVDQKTKQGQEPPSEEAAQRLMQGSASPDLQQDTDAAVPNGDPNKTKLMKQEVDLASHAPSLATMPNRTDSIIAAQPNLKYEFLVLDKLTAEQIVEIVSKKHRIPIIYRSKRIAMPDSHFYGNLVVNGKIEDVIASLKTLHMNVSYDGRNIIAGE